MTQNHGWGTNKHQARTKYHYFAKQIQYQTSFQILVIIDQCSTHPLIREDSCNGRRLTKKLTRGQNAKNKYSFFVFVFVIYLSHGL